MQTISYRYNGANQIECIDVDASGACNGTEFWTYDAYGNLTFDRATRYVYDATNHLATVCDSGDGLTCDALGNETTYQYNGDGARVAQSVRKGILPAAVTTYTLDAALPLTQVLSETTSGQTTRYLHGHDLIAQSDGTSTEYLAYDGLGSVRQLVDGSGTVLTSQTFDPYGTPYSEMGAEQSAFGFTGEETDENGLVYLRARYYNPAQGRFMQVDPSRMERNGYQYAGSSPGMNTDPSGYCTDPFAFWTVGAYAQFEGQNGAVAGFQYLAQDCQKHLNKLWEVMQNPTKYTQREVNDALADATVGPLYTDIVLQPIAAGINSFETGLRLVQGESFINVLSDEQGNPDIATISSPVVFAMAVYGGALMAEGAFASPRRMPIEPGGYVLLDSGEAIPVEALIRRAPQPSVWQYEGLRIIEDVRYSALAQGNSNEVVMRIDDTRPDFSSVADKLKRIFHDPPTSALCSTSPKPLPARCSPLYPLPLSINLSRKTKVRALKSMLAPRAGTAGLAIKLGTRSDIYMGST